MEIIILEIILCKFFNLFIPELYDWENQCWIFIEYPNELYLLIRINKHVEEELA